MRSRKGQGLSRGMAHVFAAKVVIISRLIRLAALSVISLIALSSVPAYAKGTLDGVLSGCCLCCGAAFIFFIIMAIYSIARGSMIIRFSTLKPRQRKPDGNTIDMVGTPDGQGHYEPETYRLPDDKKE